jgi:lipopolysaccharide/colanic/teichoic acid biosynthesis glycosyltransferase
MYRTVCKRLLDLSVAALGLAAALLPMAVVAVAVRFVMGLPILYRVARPGLNGRLFTLYKFRTMTDARELNGRLLSDRERVTPLGRILRRTSLDELPQLFNVLKGDMSLVGPRPLNREYLDSYTPEQARRHSVRPGITGLAQVSGRNAVSWEDRFALDVHYVDHVSFALDARILALTAVKVLRRQDVSPEGDLDVPRFTGSRSATDDSPPSSAGRRAHLNPGGDL